MDWQLLAAGLIVGLAGAYLCWRGWRTWRGAKGGCGGGCGCAKTEAKKDLISSEEILIRKR